MPVQVQEVPLSDHRKRYPWKEWRKQLDIAALKFTQGEDFEGNPHGFAYTARRGFGRLGIRVRCFVRGECVFVDK